MSNLFSWLFTLWWMLFSPMVTFWEETEHDIDMNMWYWNEVGMNTYISMVWHCYGLSELKAGTLTTMGAAPCPSEHTGTWHWYVQRTGNTKIQNHSTKQAAQMQEYKNTINARGWLPQNTKFQQSAKHKTQSLSRIPTATWNAFHIFNSCNVSKGWRM